MIHVHYMTIPTKDREITSIDPAPVVSAIWDRGLRGCDSFVRDGRAGEKRRYEAENIGRRCRPGRVPGEGYIIWNVIISWIVMEGIAMRFPSPGCVLCTV
jgi:hypothetical protein